MDRSTNLDELARRAGTVSSTVRMYQAEGLLPRPPARAGWPSATRHLARMRLIAALQERGFSLAAIKALVDTWEAGRDLADVLGLERRASTWAEEEPVRIRLSELRRRFPRGMLPPKAIKRAVGLGLIELEGASVRVNSPRFLEIGTELIALGIPLDAILDEYERLQQASAETAGRFTALFERRLWAPFAEAGMPPERVAELTGELGRLGSLAEAVVTVALREALQQRAAAFLAEHARQALDSAPEQA